jgi:acyl dehydratase
MLDQSFVGRTYPPTPPYLVGREKIREFAAAVGLDNPLHFDVSAAQAAGYADVVAPPTFAIVLTKPASPMIVDDPQLGMDYSRVLHADQRFAYARPIVAGDELVCVNTIEEITSRSGLDFLTTRTDVTTTAGELVVSAWSKLVMRGES